MRRIWPLPLFSLVLVLGCQPGDAESEDEGSSDEDSSTTYGDETGGSEDSESESSSDSESGETETGSDSESTETETGSDSETETETETETGSETDSGTDTGDEGFAAVLGDCEPLLTELESPLPSLYTFHLDFADDPYDEGDLPLLSEGAQTILTNPNAGGSSTVSEAFAYEFLDRCADATLLKIETEIEYLPEDSKKTDFLIGLDAYQVGVSVTRAVGYPPEDPYPESQAAGLIEDKLDDILISSANVVEADAWIKQILVVMAYADMHATLIADAWAALDAETKADTVVYVVITDGEDTPVYFD
ncbi:hypothetical protein G6O69_24635 [Pseudenhygromyxa sp. WMMC2535]|uniref:hypothetical protein n=1 Tax=Pseudenhygromyxa sp. WMMC2535 TaxID=2712867 RepID=UPI0015552E61|nr:hypothetical protein [Pseudenhygromyxa sp. WMMC2535]NVB41050.1 hypothetical protein [Pseudenhygromyxa sp. WMMC2535]